MKSAQTTKERLLHSALEQFATQGYHGTSVRDISSHAGVNVSLISRYFQGKQGLYESCLGYLYAQIEQNNAKILTLWQQQAFHILIPLAYRFAKENHHSLLLIQRALLFEDRHHTHILTDFANQLAAYYPHMSSVQIMLGLQSLLILLSRYALMSEQELQGHLSSTPSQTIIEHLCDLAHHIFSKETTSL